ncbi:MAG TPA: zinc-binding dehydrogenase [Gaiellaceae bacterium]|jgi:NADPH2:quinone reductase
MRAARLHEIGGAPRIDEVDEPAGGELLEVSAAALNPVDVAIGNGRFYGGTPELPYVIGSEAVGRTGDGRRVWYYAPSYVSCMAERVVASPERTVEIPDGVDDGLALACGIAGLTGWLAVAWRARVTPEDTVLVLGASGTLGATALQAAKALGARRVVGAARRVEAVPEAADDAVSLAGEYELPQATVVVDGLWGEPAERALEAAAPGVRFVQLGQSAGPTATLASAWVRGKSARILGLAVQSVPAEARAEGYRDLCSHVTAGRIRLPVETYPLESVAEAWNRQATGSPGAKIVVELGG